MLFPLSLNFFPKREGMLTSSPDSESSLGSLLSWWESFAQYFQIPKVPQFSAHLEGMQLLRCFFRRQWAIVRVQLSHEDTFPFPSVGTQESRGRVPISWSPWVESVQSMDLGEWLNEFVILGCWALVGEGGSPFSTIKALFESFHLDHLHAPLHLEETSTRAREMVQWCKVLTVQAWGLNLDPQYLHKKTPVSVITALGDGKRRDLGASHTVSIANLWIPDSEDGPASKWRS